MSQFRADRDILTTADSGPRDPHRCQLIVIHTTENADSTRPDDVATWQRDPANGSSYNLLVGTDGRTVRTNDDNYVPWAAGYTGNLVGLHASAVGRAARSRADWLALPAQLDGLARIAADWCNRYGIPARVLTADQVRAGQRGICGHNEVSHAWHEVSHTDPGPGFPYDDLLARIHRINNPPEETDEMTPEQDQIMRDIWEQLRGPGGKGWPQLGTTVDGHALTLVDGIAAVRDDLAALQEDETA